MTKPRFFSHELQDGNYGVCFGVNNERSATLFKFVHKEASELLSIKLNDVVRPFQEDEKLAADLYADDDTEVELIDAVKQ